MVFIALYLTLFIVQAAGPVSTRAPRPLEALPELLQLEEGAV